VESIDENAFALCEDLRTVIIGKSVSRIGSDAFFDCANLINVVYYGKTDPGESSQGVFEECTKLNSVNVTNNYESESFCGITELVVFDDHDSYSSSFSYSSSSSSSYSSSTITTSDVSSQSKQDSVILLSSAKNIGPSVLILFLFISLFLLIN